jgi:hypothetical protein
MEVAQKTLPQSSLAQPLVSPSTFPLSPPSPPEPLPPPFPTCEVPSQSIGTCTCRTCRNDNGLQGESKNKSYQKPRRLCNVSHFATNKPEQKLSRNRKQTHHIARLRIFSQPGPVHLLDLPCSPLIDRSIIDNVVDGEILVVLRFLPFSRRSLARFIGLLLHRPCRTFQLVQLITLVTCILAVTFVLRCRDWWDNLRSSSAGGGRRGSGGCCVPSGWLCNYPQG